MSKSSKLANVEDENESGAFDFGGAGLGGGFLACFGGKAGDGDSGAFGAGLTAPFGGACSAAKGSLPKSSLPI